jgi:glucokinase
MGPYVLGLDLGGTKVFAAAFDGELNMISHAREKTEAWRDDEEVFATIVRTGREALTTAEIDAEQVAAIGIGSPGPIDPDTGYILESANLKFRNFPLGPRLAKEFGCHVILENDVNAATYGELKSGAARGAKHVLGVFLGTGIGGGIIIDGKLFHGFSKNAGEVGHIIIKAGGPRCGCGNRGCMEAFGSRTGILRELRESVKRGEKTLLWRSLKKRSADVTSTELKEAYDAGDKLVQKVVNAAAKDVGIGIGSLVNVLGPEVIVLGGGVIEAFGDDLIARIDKTVRKIAFEVMTKDLRMVKAQLGDNAGVTGAALLAHESLRESAVAAT